MVAPQSKTIIFDLLRTVSKVPFHYQELPNTLDLEAWVRAMAILSLSGNGRMSGSSRFDSVVAMRPRSAKDECRVLFQSLAFESQELLTNSQNSDVEPIMHSKTQSMSGLEEEEIDGYCYIDVSAENPYLTDLIDVLTSSQEYRRPFASVARAFFKDVAGRFPVSQMPLSQLRMSRSDLLQLTKFILAFQQA